MLTSEVEKVKSSKFYRLTHEVKYLNFGEFSTRDGETTPAHARTKPPWGVAAEKECFALTMVRANENPL